MIPVVTFSDLFLAILAAAAVGAVIGCAATIWLLSSKLFRK